MSDFLDIAQERRFMDLWRNVPEGARSGTREHALWCARFHDSWAKSRTGWALKFGTLSLCCSGLAAVTLATMGAGIAAHILAALPLGLAVLSLRDVIECHREQVAARTISDEWAELAESLA